MSHDAFRSSGRPHVVMVTTHGIHEWQVTAGLPDTGGQNVYVNDLSATLVHLGFRVTIYNRGGYPHPMTAEMRRGASYRGAHERIVCLTDSVPEFVRKEDMGPRVPELERALARHLEADAAGDAGAGEAGAGGGGAGRGSGAIPVIISHYWDGALVAEQARRRLPALTRVPHVWIPHSLGALKKQRTRPGDWPSLRIEERIEHERRVLEDVDMVGSTSRAMDESLAREYGRTDSLFLPPCVDTTRFDREAVRADRRAAGLLAEATGRREAEVDRARIVTEISRTDRTKRKDVLIRAFARVHAQRPDTLLAVTIDPGRKDLYAELTGLIDELGLRGSVAVLGSVWEYVPSLYGITDVYCTPSIMEGFGMSIQEAAACGVPAVASERVPFAVEYLRGEGALLVPPEDVEQTAAALGRLLDDEKLRRQMGERAREITIPRFTWEAAARSFLSEAGIPVPTDAGG